MKVDIKTARMLVGVACMAIGFAAVGATPIVKDGKARADVVLEMRKSHPQLRYAAQELTNWVCKITGAELRIVAKESEAKQPVRIILGTSDLSPAVQKFAKGNKAFARLSGNDGFVIREEGDSIYLAATKTKGVLNAVYRFLERNSDIIWARPLEGDDGFGTVYGKTPDFTNTIGDLVDVPSFTHHRYWTTRGENVLRHEARLLNTWQANYLGDYASAIKYADPSEVEGGFSYLSMLAKYAESDPDIFALQPNGKRMTTGEFQLCYTNPKTVEIFVNEAEKLVKSAPRKVKEWFIGIGDNWCLCECESCKKPIVLPNGRTVDPLEQCFRSTQYNLMVDKIAAELKKRCPNFSTIRSDGYLFLATAPAYKTTRPVGPYCPYVKNHKKPVFDDAINKHWHDIAEGWKKSGQFFFSLYEYYLCHTTPLYPHAVCEVAQQDYQYYLPGLKGVYLDGGGADFEAKPGKDASLYELSAIEFWTMSRIMWDVKADVKACRREFCRRAYREAAPQMIEYHEKLAADYNADPTGCFWNDDPVIAAKHYIVEKGLADWVRDILAKAEGVAKHPSSKELIRRHRARMLELVDKAEKAPKRITYVVRQVKGTPDFDPEGAYWKPIEKLGPVTRISNAFEPVSNLTVKVAHDRANLYLLFHGSDQQRFYDTWKKFSDAGQVDNFPKDERFQWDTPYEIYLDGDLAAKGSYYMLSSMFNGHRTTCIGSSEGAPIDWKVKYAPIGTTGLATLVTVPLEAIGVDISKGNKIGAMFLGATKPGTAWNGGQWHSPGGFQTLQLEMQ